MLTETKSKRMKQNKIDEISLSFSVTLSLFRFFFYFTFSGERNVYENKMVDINLHSTKGSNKESEKNWWLVNFIFRIAIMNNMQSKNTIARNMLTMQCFFRLMIMVNCLTLHTWPAELSTWQGKVPPEILAQNPTAFYWYYKQSTARDPTGTKQ